MPLLFTSFFSGDEGGAQPFSPADLFAGGEIGIWADPSDDATCFQDVAMTTPAGNGDPVRVLLDKSGNDKHLTAPNDTSRPIRVQDGDTWYLDFTNDRLDAVAFDSQLNQPLYYCWGMKAPGPAGTANVLFGTVSGSRLEFQNVSSRWAMVGGASGSDVLFFENSDGDPHVGFGIFDSTDPHLWIDGVEQTVFSGTLGTGGVAALRIGNYSGGNRAWSGRFYGVVMSNTSFTDQQSTLEQWMADKVGIAF